MTLKNKNMLTYSTLRRSPVKPCGTKLFVTRMIRELNNGFISKRNSIFKMIICCAEGHLENINHISHEPFNEN